ncbi:helix-turn-helix domain-containing protein [Bradyrhizobium sp. CCGUVB1N3]|uniref:helix-turn-helix domain-containing protein n=1 Tax=Bradyrhizobium sp. CCGUVB1N3 TaxID=2949629 RepID=UPI0020B2C9F9|nr:helix-turn-helix transcriptional regulator [Bradyrhizobium sp. CCGUVB1N3]MCP3475649.1 helix-turn-helix domain-containing protein [Bradyrhizobium sp. CCGUVB1N3]
MKTRALVACNVRLIRLKRGISQERLAYETGIDRSYIASLERQSKNPTIDLLDRIAERLGVHVSEFFVRPSKRAGTPKTLPKGRKPPRPHRRKE